MLFNRHDAVAQAQGRHYVKINVSMQNDVEWTNKMLYHSKVPHYSMKGGNNVVGLIDLCYHLDSIYQVF